MQAFLTHLDSLLSNLSSNNLTSFICLDSNINILNTPCNIQYLSTINDNNFIQCIEKATRIHNHSFSLIDHILTNSISLEYNSGVLVSDISDHFPVFVELPSTCSDDVNISYGIFWDTLKTLFYLNFPLSKKKFNKKLP